MWKTIIDLIKKTFWRTKQPNSAGPIAHEHQIANEQDRPLNYKNLPLKLSEVTRRLIGVGLNQRIPIFEDGIL